MGGFPATFYQPIGATSVGGGYARTWKVEGQVPSREVLRGLKSLEKPALRFDPRKLLDHTEPRMTVDSVLSGLGLDQGRRNSWRKFLNVALHQDNEAAMRKDVLSRSLYERMDPALRRAILQRSSTYYRSRRGRLHKASPRGGKYHRRAAKPGGGFRYYYDPGKYERSRDAQVEGKSAARAHVQKAVGKLLESRGKTGCEIGDVRGLVKRYGAEVVGEALDDMRSSGNLTFAGGKLYRKGGPKTKFVITGA